MADMTMFDLKTCESLKYYVYRLIDPRDGATFYVGKGKDNRVFSHLNFAAGSADDHPKFQLIAEIRRNGLEPLILIHRHGLDEGTAFAVEAALIDVFPGAANLVSGHDADDFGCCSETQIRVRYEAKIADFSGISGVLINIRRALQNGRLPYDGARYHWKIDSKKANECGIVIAHDSGLIRAVFEDCRWSPDNDPQFADIHRRFPHTDGDRYAFTGRPASSEHLKALEMQRLNPDTFQKRGAANPIRYTF